MGPRAARQMFPRAFGYRSTVARDQTDKSTSPEQTVSAINLAETCSGLAPGVTDLPVDHIGDEIQPTGEQTAALDDLKSAASRAADVLKASCPSETPLTPLSRLDAVEKRFRALAEAVEILRAPLDSFYDSLTDPPRQRFEAMGGSASRAERSDGLGAALQPSVRAFH